MDAPSPWPRVDAGRIAERSTRRTYNLAPRDDARGVDAAPGPGARAADAAFRGAKPLDNTDFQLGWRKRVARTFVTGALRELRGDDPAALGALSRRAASLPLVS